MSPISGNISPIIIPNQSQFSSNVNSFKNAISESGIVLNLNSNEPHHLLKEQALIVRDLIKYLETGESQKDRSIKIFLVGLTEYCKKEKYFKKFLTPTQFKTSTNSNIIIHQDSLISLFLRVPAIQNEIIDMLLEAITVASVEEQEDTSWLRTLLKPLRCLPSIKNGKELAKKLLDILEISTFASQLEILDAIPEIIPDSETDQIAKQLTKLLDGNDELSGAIIDCLNSLNLESSIRAQVHDRILAKLLTGTSPKIFPILHQFLMSDYKSQNLHPVLMKIRNSLDNMMAGGNSKETESCKIVIFHHIQRLVVSQKAIAEAWLAVISNIKSHVDHKPIDFLMMFLLHYTSEIRKKVIEAIFRKRVSTGLFKVALLEKTFEKYFTQQLLKDYMNSIIQIGCYLIRFSKDATVAKFATTLFETLFNHIYNAAIYRGEILSSLISLMGSNDASTINTVLKLMSSLVLIDYQKVQVHMPLLMQLLEKLESLDLKAVKIVFDILCSLLCNKNGNDSLSGFKDEIFITISKQLSSSKRTFKHRGIISAVVMAKHMASIDLENTEMSEASKEAQKLLELVVSSAGDCSELLGLYYDQLASIFVSDEIFDKFFLYWLYELATEDFNRIFVSQAVPEATNDLSFSLQYNLNASEEIDELFGIDIARYTVCDRNEKILLLSPHFRLLRLVHLRQHDGALSAIDALLGCGVILPEADDPSDLDSEQIRLVVDCLFHCINWFREVISAFVTQKELSIQQKVVNRLQHLIDMEQRFYLFMDEVPGHNLPVSYFDLVMNVGKQLPIKSDTKPAKRKKVKTTSIANDLNDTTMNTQKSTSASTSKKGLTQRVIVNFRELDTDLIKLLKYPLKLTENHSTQKIALNIGQINFILKDFMTKLRILTENRDIGLSHLNDVNPENLIKDCVKILPYINEYLKIIVRQIRTQSEATDERRDLQAEFSQEARDVKTCFGYILEIFYLIFQWPGFQHTTNVDLLRSLLKSMRPETSQTLHSANRLIIEFIERMSGLGKECCYLSHAVALIKIMEVLHNATVPSKDIEKKIAITSQYLLSRRWYNLKGDVDHGKDCNQNINVLVKAYLTNANTKNIFEIAETVKVQAESLLTKEDCLEMLPAINKQNFHVLYLGLCNALLTKVKSELDSLTNSQHLTLWQITAATLVSLKDIVKDQKNRTNMSCFLKKSIGILKIFLTHGVPMMEIMLKSESEQVLGIFRTVQSTTRFLHNLCCHSKLTQDASLVSHVPSFRHTLESLVYRVKAALVANNCSAAFWMGALKNRDIDGEDIVSQSTVVSSTREETDDNEQLPSDEDDDQNIINNDENDDNSDESKVYG